MNKKLNKLIQTKKNKGKIHFLNEETTSVSQINEVFNFYVDNKLDVETQKN